MRIKMLFKSYDDHTLATVIPEIEKQVGVPLKRIFCDAATRATTRQLNIASKSTLPARSAE